MSSPDWGIVSAFAGLVRYARTLQQRGWLTPRRAILAAGLAAFLAVGLFPPWIEVERRRGIIFRTHGIGHAPLWSEPVWRQDASGTWVKMSSGGFLSFSAEVDKTRLGVYWILIVVTTAGVYALVGMRRAARDRHHSEARPALIGPPDEFAPFAEPAAQEGLWRVWRQDGSGTWVRQGSYSKRSIAERVAEDLHREWLGRGVVICHDGPPTVEEQDDVLPW